MIRTFACTTLFALFLCTPFGALAQGYGAEIHLHNGSILRGTVVDQDAAQLALVIGQPGDPALTLQMADISAIVQLPVTPATITAPVEFPQTGAATPARNGRAVGFGMNMSVGFGHKYTTNTILTDPEHFDGHMDLELPGFEFRIFPEENFSLDLLFKFGQSAQHSAWATSNGFSTWAGTNVVLLNMYFHFYGPRVAAGDGFAAFSFAPGLILGGGTYYTVVPVGGQVGLSFRLGAEFTDPDQVFGFGVHFRPGVTAGAFHEDSFYSQDDVMPGVEGMIEFTWTWFAPRPTGA